MAASDTTCWVYPIDRAGTSHVDRLTEFSAVPAWEPLKERTSPAIRAGAILTGSGRVPRVNRTLVRPGFSLLAAVRAARPAGLRSIASALDSKRLVALRQKARWPTWAISAGDSTTVGGVARGFAAGVTGCSLCWVYQSDWRCSGAAELVRAGPRHGCTCPLQGQAQQHQEASRQAHRLWIMGRCWFWQVNRRPSAAIPQFGRGE